MKPRIYIDTSVFGLSIAGGAEAKTVFMREYANAFLNGKEHFEGFISEVVIAEAEAAPVAMRNRLLGALLGFPLLPMLPLVLDVARLYRERFIMPVSAEADSLHVALAVVNKMDYLVTWNIKHMANPRKHGALRVVNAGLGLPAPVMCTPFEWVTGGEEEAQ